MQRRTRDEAGPGQRLPDLVCLSHLRWGFVFQRPQHLMTRFARERRVFFVEEPIFDEGDPRVEMHACTSGVQVVVPHLPPGFRGPAAIAAQRIAIERMFREHQIAEHVLWYYTPMALPFTAPREADAVLYDCMDDLTGFDGAPAELSHLEARLLSHADVVLTGGHSLYEAKRHLHPNIHPVPSSVDVAHFSRALEMSPDDAPSDQRAIPFPILGFFGVIDERMDLALVDGIAAARPDWHIVLIGPVVKIDQATLPRRPNIHYLGAKKYEELPAYLASWDVALLPFARNRSTRFISPTKTPEYLAAGKAVVSTSIRDVVRPYGERGLVRIADTVDEQVAAIEACLAEPADERRALADTLLATMSWDRTFAQVKGLLDEATERRATSPATSCATSTELQTAEEA